MPSPRSVTDDSNTHLLLDVPEKPERALRINVTLPEGLVRSIDRVAANRPRFLAAAARDRLRRQRNPLEHAVAPRSI